MSTIQAQWPVSSLLSRAEDLPWLVERAPGSAPILRHMMAAASIDENRVPPRALDDLARSCSDCGQKQLCANEIGTGHAIRSFVDYCPSAETLLRLR